MKFTIVLKGEPNIAIDIPLALNPRIFRDVKV